jgi:hypothetical protein
MIAPGQLIIANSRWKVFRQDAGMGEKEYRVFRNDEFFCQTNNQKDAEEIIRCINYCGNVLMGCGR